MDSKIYFLSPIEVVQVTKQNLAEVAEWCGGQLGETDSKRNPGTKDAYVWVPVSGKNTISWAFPGMYVTKRCAISGQGDPKVTYGVFRRDYFENNYFEKPGDAFDKTWGKMSEDLETIERLKDQTVEKLLTAQEKTPRELVEEARSKPVVLMEEPKPKPKPMPTPMVMVQEPKKSAAPSPADVFKSAKAEKAD